MGCRPCTNIWGLCPDVHVLDNAIAAGRRVGDTVTESEIFRRFRLHHRFEAWLCNPYSGNEIRQRGKCCGVRASESSHAHAVHK